MSAVIARSDATTSAATTSKSATSGPNSIVNAESTTETAATFTVETPEHVQLHWRLAELGSRVIAVSVDVGLIAFVSFLVFGAGSLVAGSGSADGLVAFTLLFFFLLRTFYFMVAESRGLGRTFGKRKLGLRVVAADGGPLTVEQIVARNLTREIEIFLPLGVLASEGRFLPESPAWANAAALLWVIGFASLPFFNQRRARLGDLIAGTLVVVEPSGVLESDLADSGGATPDFQFTQAQLDIYGIKELQVLEDVLRRPLSSSRDELLRRILDRVVAKISWPESVAYQNAESFLYAFYAAQRKRLENQMLLGKRREQKVR